MLINYTLRKASQKGLLIYHSIYTEGAPYFFLLSAPQIIFNQLKFGDFETYYWNRTFFKPMFVQIFIFPASKADSVFAQCQNPLYIIAIFCEPSEWTQLFYKNSC